MELEFYVDAYGAAGDGVTNDAYAINAAVNAAKEAPPEAVKHIIFSCEKTYRITEVPENNRLNCLFCLDRTENISIEGKGAKLLFSAEASRRLKEGICSHFWKRQSPMYKTEALRVYGFRPDRTVLTKKFCRF